MHTKSAMKFSPKFYPHSGFSNLRKPFIHKVLTLFLYDVVRSVINTIHSKQLSALGSKEAPNKIQCCETHNLD